MNDLSETSPSILWEAFKAYIRGSIISFEASRRKENISKLKDLEEQIKMMDQENARSPSASLHRKITTLKYEYNQIMSVKISKAFLYTRQRFFEFGDKPHKLLARQLRKMESDRTIHKVKARDNTILTKPKDINNRFLEYYADLYTSKSTSEFEIMNKFLGECELPRLTAKDCEFLNSQNFSKCGREVICQNTCKQTRPPTGEVNPPRPDRFYTEQTLNFQSKTPV